MSEELFEPQLLTKEKVVINTSTSKQMYSFGKRKRFADFSKTNENFFYNLLDYFQKKTKLKKLKKQKTPNRRGR